MPVGENRVNWITELVSGTMQLGTHLDALSHLQIGNRGYNGWSVAEMARPNGVARLGIETVPQIVTRGWLVDVSSSGLEAGGVIGRDSVVDIDPEPGDAVLFHTGWGQHWMEAEAYLSGEPGPGMELAEWLAKRGVALTGCDTWSYGPVPAEEPSRPFAVPQMLNVRHGVFIVENLDTEALAADGVSQFALVLTHPKHRGATGAWTSPIALVGRETHHVQPLRRDHHRHRRRRRDACAPACALRQAHPCAGARRVPASRAGQLEQQGRLRAQQVQEP
jgi:kynurenine formamidase